MQSGEVTRRGERRRQEAIDARERQPAEDAAPSRARERLGSVAAVVGGLLVAAFFVCAAVYYTGQPAPMPGAESESVASADAPIANAPSENVSVASSTPFVISDPAPPLSSTAGPLDVVLLGDSVGGNMAQALRDHGGSGITPLPVWAGGCGLFDAEKARAGNGWIMDSKERCWDWQDKLRAVGNEKQPDVYVVHNKWDAEDQLFDSEWIAPCENAWAERYRSQLETLIGIGNELRTPPLILFSNDRPREWSNTMTAERLACKSAVEDEFIATYPQAHRLDLDAAVCPEGFCATETPAGQPLYADDRVHFTPEAKQLLAPWLEDQIAKAWQSRL